MTYKVGDLVWLKATTVEDFGYENSREQARIMSIDGDMVGADILNPVSPDCGVREFGIDQIEGLVKCDHKWGGESQETTFHYDEPEEEGGPVPDSLRTLLQMPPFDGKLDGNIPMRIVVECTACGDYGVWKDDDGSKGGNWFPKSGEQPDFMINEAEYEDEVGIAW